MLIKVMSKYAFSLAIMMATSVPLLHPPGLDGHAGQDGQDGGGHFGVGHIGVGQLGIGHVEGPFGQLGVGQTGVGHTGGGQLIEQVGQVGGLGQGPVVIMVVT